MALVVVQSHNKIERFSGITDFPNEVPKMDLTARKASAGPHDSSFADDDDEEVEDDEEEAEPQVANSSGMSGIDVEMADMSTSVTDQSSP